MYRNVRVIVVVILIILALKVCLIAGADLAAKNATYRQAHAARKANNSTTTTSSYFRHDPFGPNTYAFGYEVNDNRTGNVQFRDERRYVNGSVQGSFGFVRADGCITVTHFLADKQRGYLSQTSTFEPGDRTQWEEHWPTRRPDILVNKTAAVLPLNVTYDSDQHLNVTPAVLPAQLANAVEQHFGVDVNGVGLEKNLVSPTVLDIVNGKLPLETQPLTKPHVSKPGDTKVGFQPVVDFIPPGFPIVPFELPQKLDDQQHAAAMPAEQKSQQERGKENNAEKAMPALSAAQKVSAPIVDTAGHVAMPPMDGVAKVRDGATKIAAKPVTLSGVDKDDKTEKWYRQVVEDTRKEFLANIPKLQTNPKPTSHIDSK